MGNYRNADFSWLPAFDEMVGPKPPDDFVSDGATMAPDVLLGTNFRIAAHWHDFGYSEECRPECDGFRDEVFRARRDREFLLNLKACGAPAWVARTYYFRVRLWGHRSFDYDPGCEPKQNLSFWFGLFVGRYIEW